MSSHLYIAQYKLIEELADLVFEKFSATQNASARIEKIALALCGLRCAHCDRKHLQGNRLSYLDIEDMVIYADATCTPNQFSFEVARQISRFLLHTDENGILDSYEDSTIPLLRQVLSSSCTAKKNVKEVRRNQETKQLAGALLVPRSHLIEKAVLFTIVDDIAVRKLAEYFDVSPRMILTRIGLLAEYGEWKTLKTDGEKLYDLKYSLDHGLLSKNRFANNYGPHSGKHADSASMTNSKEHAKSWTSSIQMSLFDYGHMVMVSS